MNKLWYIIGILAGLALAFFGGRWTASQPPPERSDTIFVASPPVVVKVEKIVPKPYEVVEQIHDTVMLTKIAECPLYHPMVKSVIIDTANAKFDFYTVYRLPTPNLPYGLATDFQIHVYPDTVKVPIPVYVKTGITFWECAAIAVGTAGIGIAVGSTLK